MYFNKFLDKKNYLYLIIFFPITLFTGIAVGEFFSALIIFYYIFNSNNKLKDLRDKKILFLLIICFYIAVNALVQINSNLKYSPIFFFRFVVFSLSVAYIFDLLIKNNSNKKRIFSLDIFFFFITIIILDSLIQFFFGKNLLGYEIINNRISSFLGEELILGSFLTRTLPTLLFFVVLFNYELTKRKRFFIIFLSFYFFSIYLSAERTSFVLMIILISSLMIFVKRFRKILYYSTFIFIILILLTSFFDLGKSNPSNRLFLKTFNQLTNEIFSKKNLSPVDIVKKSSENIEYLSNSNLLKNIKIFSSDHHGHIELGYELFRQNKVFGSGPRGFRQYCETVNFNPKIGICSTHPHNYFIQILSETGLVGIFLYSLTFFFILFKIKKCLKKKVPIKKKDEFLILSFGLLIYFFPFLPGGNFFNNWISLTNFYLLGIYFFSYKHIFN